jgi:hypothetical protein
MPDKSQNITINYKFNTQDVAGATATLNRANEASNKLQQAAGNAGSAISKEFQKSNKTILDMQTTLTRLKSNIEVTSNPQKLKQLSQEYANVKRQLDAATKSAFGFNDALKKQGNDVTSLSTKFGNLYSAAQAVFGAAIIRQVVNTTLEMAKLSGQAAGVERGFNRAFPASTATLMQLREATRGTITDFELMQRTLQATNLGVSVKELPQLFEFAAARAQQTGESVDYLVDSIVRGIGRKSPLILDNLGISAVRLKEKFDGAALASQSVGDVTKAVAEIAQEELGKMGGFAETSATKVDKLAASMSKLKLVLSERLTSGGLIDFFNNQVNNITELFKGSTDALLDRAKESGAADALRILQGQTLKDLKDNEQAKTDFIQQEINSRVEIERKYAVDIAAMSAELLKIRKNDVLLPGEVARIQFLEKQILSSKLAVISMKEARITLKAFLDDLTKADEAPESTGIIERKKKEIEALQEAIEKTNKLSDLGVGGKLTSQLEIAQAELGDLQRAFLDFKVKEFEDRIKNATQALTDFVDVANGVSGSGRMDVILSRIDADIRNGIQGTQTKPPAVFEPSDWDKIKDDFVENWRDITSAGIDIQADQLKSIAETELQSYKLRLDNLRNYYDEQMLLAGDNEKAKDQLRLREERETTKLRNDLARKEKQVRKTQVLIDVAAGIAKAFATYPWPYALIPAAFVAAQGAAQLAIINRQPTNFAKGVINLKGPGTETSDSIPANLSRGESVMTAWETRVAGDVLKEVRAKKLDNRELKRLKEGRSPVVSQKFSDAGIIKAIKDQKHPDLVKASNIVYESREYSDGYKKRVRSSSMGI